MSEAVTQGADILLQGVPQRVGFILFLMPNDIFFGQVLYFNDDGHNAQITSANIFSVLRK